MHIRLLDYLCDPIDGADLKLAGNVTRDGEQILTGDLISTAGRHYPIINGVPRFILDPSIKTTVTSFGDEWNNFQL